MYKLQWMGSQAVLGCSDVLARAEGAFVCKVCESVDVNGESGDVNEGIDRGDEVCVENVGKFCYLGDTLNGNGGVNSASVARVRCAWKKFKELSGS